MLLRRNYMALCQKVSDFMPNFKGGSRLVRCSFLFALINSFLEACVRVYFCFWHVFGFILTRTSRTTVYVKKNTSLETAPILHALSLQALNSQNPHLSQNTWPDQGYWLLNFLHGSSCPPLLHDAASAWHNDAALHKTKSDSKNARYCTIRNWFESPRREGATLS